MTKFNIFEDRKRRGFAIEFVPLHKARGVGTYLNNRIQVTSPVVDVLKIPAGQSGSIWFHTRDEAQSAIDMWHLQNPPAKPSDVLIQRPTYYPPADGPETAIEVSGVLAILTSEYQAVLNNFGTAEGELCNRDGCEGNLEFTRSINCSCHLGCAPCPSCEAIHLFCPECGWVPEGISPF